MSTPESKVKKKVKNSLEFYGEDLYFNMPVPSGYGESMLDFVGCFCGRFFMVETKAEGKDLTPRQQFVANRVKTAGGRVFVITGVDGNNHPDSWAGWHEFSEWLDDMHAGRYT